MRRALVSLAIVASFTVVGRAETIRVPQDHKTVQAGIDAAKSGDVVLVSPGIYKERIKLKPGVTLRSAGDEAKGEVGLKRAEATILDGGGAAGKGPGATLAEGSTIDGFTITNVGVYDQATWTKHFNSKGEELGDEEGAAKAEGSTPAVSAVGVSCTIHNCVVHHNGDVGISLVGVQAKAAKSLVEANEVFRNMGGGIGIAEGAVADVVRNRCRENLRAGIGCRKASPLIAFNVCEGNIRAGVGIREGAKPAVEKNQCRNNRRAGIGIRMEGTSPRVQENTCEGNEMAGIGCRDGASPVLLRNRCQKNKLAGIGCKDGARPTIEANQCIENDAAGIGVSNGASATIFLNHCIDNKLVAIGVVQKSSATIKANTLRRTGGQPPLVAIKDGSTAEFTENHLTGGGVAAVLVEGSVTVAKNTIVAAGPKQGTAVWVWAKSKATVSSNQIDGYRTAVNASKAEVVITDNRIDRFQGTAIIVRESSRPATVTGNQASSADPKARVVDVQGPAGAIENNTLKIVEKVDSK